MIRQATKKDVSEVSELIYMILDEKESYFTENYIKKEVMAFIRHAYAQEISFFSYANIIVKEIEGQVVGIALMYDSKMTDAFCEQWENDVALFFGEDQDEFETSEAQPGEFHLDTIAVVEEFRGQGIAKELLEKMDQKAYSHGHTKLSLNVSAKNIAAKRLYERHHYKVECQFLISSHTYFHMTKSL
ncbi:GNAT family N-acetyltransferase [Paenibacillus sp. FSL K6-0276]|uniref:GNAT family N-acetyltransferase n=1 Tax=Paenibacillus sp. FSL K6-0276 TaxID=2921450 RepID=UPI0030EB6C8E